MSEEWVKPMSHPTYDTFPTNMRFFFLNYILSLAICTLLFSRRVWIINFFNGPYIIIALNYQDFLEFLHFLFMRPYPLLLTIQM